MIRNGSLKMLNMALIVVLALSVWGPLTLQSSMANVQAASTDSYPNLLENPSFEAETLAPWFSTPLATSAERSEAAAYTGTVALKFTPREGQYSNVRQQVTLKRGVTYAFTAWVRAADATTQTQWAQMKLDYAVSSDTAYKPGGTSYPQLARQNNVQTQWVKLSGTHSYQGELDEVTLYLYFEACQRTNCAFYLDDVEVVALPYANELSIVGDETIMIPEVGSQASHYTANAWDQYGMVYEEIGTMPAWTYQVEDTDALISVSESVYMEVPAGTTPGYVTLRAQWPSDDRIFAEKRVIIGQPAPLALDVHIQGDRYSGGQLTAAYGYVGYYPEGQTSYRWEIAEHSEGPFLPISGETAPALTLRTEWENYYIRVVITPVDTMAQFGNSVVSDSIPLVYPRSAYYVDPINGDDSQSGTIEAPFATIERAQEEVRAQAARMQEDVTVYLRGGEYNYAERFTSREQTSRIGKYEIRRSTLVFDDRDSGQNGHQVIYKAYPGEVPVISGGKRVDGWTLHDAARGIYKAQLDTGLELRNFYVNGERAIVARSEGPPAGLTLELGYGHTTTDTSMADWDNIDQVEFVYYSHWVQHRIKLDTVEVNDGLAKLNMYPRAWKFAIDTGTPGIYEAGHLQYIENAYELLDTQGEWYYNRTSGELFYMPRTGEDMTTVEAVIPLVDELLTVAGRTLDTPVHDLVFSGLHFEYTRWIRPNTLRSHHANQNNVIRDDGRLPEGAVTFDRADGLVFTRNHFSKLGSTGLLARQAIWNNEIVGNTFEDISGSGMSIGDHTMVNDAAVTQDIRLMPRGNRIHNNVISRVAVEYVSGTAISMSMGQDNEIMHNEISDIPYTGIHMSFHTDNWSKNQRIANNEIRNLMTDGIYDGGAIYTLGTTRGSSEEPGYLVEGNYIRNQLNSAGAFFPDNTSTWWLARNNVIDLRQMPLWKFGDHGLNVHINTGGANHRFIDTYSTLSAVRDLGMNNSFVDTHVYPQAIWPAEALAIMANSGLQSDYRDLWDASRFDEVRNGGFETRQDAVWQTVDAQWQRSAAHHRAGVKSALVTPEQPQGHIRQTLVWQPGVTYELAAWVRLTAAQDELASFMLDFGEGATPLTLATVQATAGNWTKLSGTYTHSGAVMQTSGDLYVQVAGTGLDPYYVDEVQAIASPHLANGVLADALDTAWLLHDQASEGATPGMYTPGAKAELAIGLTQAESILAGAYESQAHYLALRQLHGYVARFDSLQIQLGDPAALAMLLAEAITQYEAAEVGIEPGMYSEAATVDLQHAIDAASLVLQTVQVSEGEMQQALQALQHALMIFADEQIVLNLAYLHDYQLRLSGQADQAVEGQAPGEYASGSIADLRGSLAAIQTRITDWQPGTDAVHRMLVDGANWQLGSLGEDPWELGISGRGVKYVGDRYQDEWFEMDLSYTYQSTGDWPGFVIRSQRPDTTISRDETSYMVLFKSDQWELQKWHEGKREMLIGEIPNLIPRWGTLENTHIQSGQVHRVAFGAQNVEQGVRLALEVDGEMVFDVIDTIDPITDPGYVAVYATANPLHLRPVGEDSGETLVGFYEALRHAEATFAAAHISAQTANGLPAQGTLSHNNGQDYGLQDGDYEVRMDMWWGENATTYRLYENDVMIDEQSLANQTPSAQFAITAITGKGNGIYQYDAELVNAQGSTWTGPLLVKVDAATPSKPHLSHTNWLHTSNYEIKMNLWWGTNASTYQLYENGVLIDTVLLESQTPHAQHAVTSLEDRSPGIYVYQAVLLNAAGEQRSDELRVEVKSSQ